MDAVFGAPTVIAGGYEFAALVVAVLGAMLITGEYSTGMIRSTFAAAPGRRGAFAAKATVLAVVTAALTTVSLLLGWLVSFPILNANDMTLDWSDGDDAHFRQLADASRREQASVEASDELPFESFRERYLSPLQLLP